jgi:hypothetical protein
MPKPSGSRKRFFVFQMWEQYRLSKARRNIGGPQAGAIAGQCKRKGPSERNKLERIRWPPDIPRAKRSGASERRTGVEAPGYRIFSRSRSGPSAVEMDGHDQRHDPGRSGRDQIRGDSQCRTRNRPLFGAEKVKTCPARSGVTGSAAPATTRRTSQSSEIRELGLSCRLCSKWP